MNESIFTVNNLSIYKKRSVLDKNYIPSRLIARDEQIKDVANLIQPILSHDSPQSATIYGKTGTGKSVVVRYVLQKLKETLPEDRTDVVSIYLNCEDANTTTKILVSILNQLAPDINLPKRGISALEYYDVLWKILNKRQLTVIFVFDEIDNIKDDNILYNLSRAGERMMINNDIHIGILGLSNDLLFIDRLDSRVVSSFGRRNFVFPPYNANELKDILEDRAKLAFRDGALNDSVIPLCAALSAQEHGDAREAILLLKTAGDIAVREKTETITEKHVRRSYDEMNLDCVTEAVKSFPIQSKLVLLSIIELSNKLGGRISTGQVESEYRKLCDQTDVKPLHRSGVSARISELDMLGVIDAPVTIRGRKGKTRLITVGKNIERVKKVLLNDYRLESLISLKN